MFALSFVRGTLPKMFQPKEWELFTGLILDEPQAASGGISWIDESRYTAVSKLQPQAASGGISWIDESRYTAVSKLQAHLPTLYNNLQLSDQGTWSEFSRAVDCENAVPSAIEAKITPFQKVLLIQAVRPDRLYAAMQNFVLKTLGKFIVLVFYLVQLELEELAAKTIGSHNYISISMGQGQEQATIDGIRRASTEGQWLCLNNVHLMLSIIPTIQKELASTTLHENFRLWMTTEEERKFPAVMLQRSLKELTSTTLHENFRLWMTTEEEGKFPTVMLQRSLKVTFEPPPGLRNNLLRTYSQIDEARRSALTLQAIFVLAWLHALLQERRTFIPQAWTKFYEFSNSDVRVARVFVETFIKESKADWEFIRGLLMFVIYGGRIENVFDSQVLESYLITFFTSEKVTGRSGQLLAKGIELPAMASIQEFRKFITTAIPAEDDPSLFGLPVNIKFSWELTEAENTIARIRTAVKTTTGHDRNSWAQACTPILQLWKRLCQGNDLHSRQLPNPKESSDPITEVVSLEFIHAIKLVQKIHASLTLVNKSVKGTVTPDKVTLEVINSLQLHQTPDTWCDLWLGPREPAEYLSTLIYKVDDYQAPEIYGLPIECKQFQAKSVQELVSRSEQPDFLKTPLNFSQLFRPGRLLNALRQVTARTKGCTMDDLRLSSAWESSYFGDDIAVQVKGILLQGALFDGQLRSTLASSPPVTNAPQLTLGWTQVGSPNVYNKQECISVPLYTDASRSELIATVQMKCSDVHRWNIASVALFLR
ncbi:unnamed protein product [Strongylus vulgaris]|uniref:Dynein heavy chain region D6 P-loop domain-containing protein n=1 Tax=Strongylus vulgaris TaxID=40348 RepID=A0A3P7IU38_STRVU|nr:unnamed protein product [Strongylus vulgaris]